MRKACLALAFTSTLSLGAWAQTQKLPVQPTVRPSAQPDTVGAGPSAPEAPIASPVDTAKAAPDSAAVAIPPETPEPSQPQTPSASPADVAAAPASAPAPVPDRRLINDWSLAGRQYGFGIAGQAVAGALGFFIGSAIETAIAGEENAHKGTLSFTEIRYDNFYGAFWGASVGGLFGSALTVYFTGQSDEEDGGFFWTVVGTGLAGAGALYAAHLMGVNDEPDWKPFMPLLAIPSAGGVLGFHVSRWFSDRKRESIMGPDAGIRVHAPRFAWIPGTDGLELRVQALNLTF